MSRLLVDTAHQSDGVPGLALEGDRLRLTLFPSTGAKIYELIHRPTGVNLLWTNPRVPLRPTYPGAAFDDVWCGGWDELFPTDTPCEFDGNSFHDHGDLWHGPWEWTIERDDGVEATVHLRRFAVALPCLMEKWITLLRDEQHVSFVHRLTNIGQGPVPFVWNLHVAHSIDPSSRIHLPTRSVSPVSVQPGRFGDGPEELSWPSHGDVDMGAVPSADAGLTEWLYTRELDEGWCAVMHPSHGVGLSLTFDEKLFKTVWLWGVYGGWRGHYVLLTEPCTSAPGGLAASIADGTAAWIESGGMIETRVVATILNDVRTAAPDERPTGVRTND